MFLMFYFLRPAPTIGVGKNRFIMKSEISPARFFIIKSLISFRLSIKSDTSPRLIIKSEISFRLSMKSSSSSPENKIQGKSCGQKSARVCSSRSAEPFFKETVRLQIFSVDFLM